MTFIHKRARVLEFARASFVAVLLIPSIGCSGEVERRWSEEVELEDGSVLVVDRHVKFKESNALGGGAYSATETRSTLAFRGEQEALPMWDVPLMPMVLYLDKTSHEWVIVATTTTCEVRYERGDPPLPYWEFRTRVGDQEWKEIPLSASSINRKTNLFIDYTASNPPREVAVGHKKQVIQANDFAPRFLSVRGDVKNRCR